MLTVEVTQGEEVRLSGRFDATQAEKARAVFARIRTSCNVSFEGLQYISSAGLSVLLETQRRLRENGHGLRLVRMNPLVKNVFFLAGFNVVFDIE